MNPDDRVLEFKDNRVLQFKYGHNEYVMRDQCVYLKHGDNRRVADISHMDASFIKKLTNEELLTLARFVVNGYEHGKAIGIELGAKDQAKRMREALGLEG